MDRFSENIAWFGAQVMTCPDCEGAGERSTPCNTCGGDGRVRKSKRIALRVPPGAPLWTGHGFRAMSQLLAPIPLLQGLS